MVSLFWNKNANFASKWQTLALVTAFALLIFGGIVDFIPSEHFHNISKYVSFFLAFLITIPTGILLFQDKLMVKYILPKLFPNNKNKILGIVLMHLLFWILAFAAISNGIGFILHMIYSEPYAEIQEISKLRESKYRRPGCRYEMHLSKFKNRDTNNYFCVEKEQFNTYKVNDKIKLSGKQSYFGQSIDTIREISH